MVGKNKEKLKKSRRQNRLERQNKTYGGTLNEAER